MNFTEKSFVASLVRLLALYWLVRAIGAGVKWMYFGRVGLELDDEILGFAQNIVAIDFIVSLIAAGLLFVFATRIADLMAGPSEPVMSQLLAHAEREILLLVGLRLVALVVLIFGLVHAVSAIAGWFLQTWSGSISHGWFPEAELRAGAIRGVVASVIALALLSGSSRLARRFGSANS